MTLSMEATDLLGRAQSSDSAVELYLAPGGTRLVAGRIVEVMLHAPLESLTDRALWNLLFAAGELSLRVDVYRAHDLFCAAVALVERIAPAARTVGDPRAAALEMAFDFFFARPHHPLLPLRSREVLAALGALLTQERAAARAALHGLGHLVALGRQAELPGVTDDALAALDDYERTCPGVAADDSLAELCSIARSGDIR